MSWINIEIESAKSWFKLGVFVAIIQTAVIFAAQGWFTASINAHFDKALEDYKLELKSREQAATIAEYSSLAISLSDTDDVETYRKANKLAWELFLWLPTDVYRELGFGLKNKNHKEMADALVDVRKLLLGDRAGSLGPNDLIGHWPRIGAQKSGQ